MTFFQEQGRIVIENWLSMAVAYIDLRKYIKVEDI